MKELSKELKEAATSNKEVDLGKNPYRALGLYFDGVGYKFAKFDYNPENRAVVFSGLKDQYASRVPGAAHMAKFNFEEVASEEIFSRLEEDYV